jgi:uncharacterized protein YdcH (DUF465 family)
MKDKISMARLEKLVERHNELRRDMNKAELEIQAHINNRIKNAKSAELNKLWVLTQKLRYANA